MLYVISSACRYHMKGFCSFMISHFVGWFNGSIDRSMRQILQCTTKIILPLSHFWKDVRVWCPQTMRIVFNFTVFTTLDSRYFTTDAFIFLTWRSPAIYRSGVLGVFWTTNSSFLDHWKDRPNFSFHVTEEFECSVISLPLLLTAPVVASNARWQEVASANTLELKIGRLIIAEFVLDSKLNVIASCCRLRSHH